MLYLIDFFLFLLFCSSVVASKTATNALFLIKTRLRSDRLSDQLSNYSNDNKAMQYHNIHYVMKETHFSIRIMLFYVFISHRFASFG